MGKYLSQLCSGYFVVCVISGVLLLSGCEIKIAKSPAIAGVGAIDINSGDLPILAGKEVPFTSPYESCSSEDMRWMGLAYARDRYLFANELPVDVDIESYDNTNSLIKAIRVSDKDPFSFAMTGEAYEQSNERGVYSGFGFKWRYDEELGYRYITRLHDGPAADAGMERGDRIISINGHSASEIERLFDDNQAETVWRHPEDLPGSEFVWQSYDGKEREANIVETEVNLLDVQDYQILPDMAKTTGYLSYQRFGSYSEAQLDKALDYFSDKEVEELIIDLRYNPGGLVRLSQKIASSLLSKNDQGADLIRYDYLGTADYQHSFDFPYMKDRSLPVTNIANPLDLTRVYILATGSSCSASEMLINSLKPFIEVIHIGSTTCGKPLGMHPLAYCEAGAVEKGERWFFVNFEVKNANNQGGYYSGLTPDCAVDEGKIVPWGDVNDALISAAIHHMDYGHCPAPSPVAARSFKNSQTAPQPKFDFRAEYMLIDHL